MACIVIPRFTDRDATRADGPGMAGWIHDHLSYGNLSVLPKFTVFDIGWHERPKRRIDSRVPHNACLTRLGMANHDGSYAGCYRGLHSLRGQG